MSDINALLSRLPKVKRYGNSYRACCPAHGGDGQNLKISQTQEGHILLKCFSHGCAVEDIVGAIGLTLQDIMPEERHSETVKPKANLLTASEGLKLVQYEARLVLASAYAIRKGQFLADDLARLEKSVTRINNVTQACGL